MPHMPYSRRARLVGSSLARPQSVTIRGDLRRKDSDDNSDLPYFDGLPTSGGTLTVSHTQAGTVSTVTAILAATPSGILPLIDVLDQLNGGAGLNTVDVEAVDRGGCITVVSYSATPSDCILEVTGGTAAAALGFDLAKQRYTARSGDLASAPEGGIGNSFGAVLPLRGENFNTDTLTRAIGRVMANTDVLASELDREEVVMQKLGVFTGPTLNLGATGRLPLSGIQGLSASQRVYTAAFPQTNKVLSSTSTAKDLEPYFTIVDRSTGKVSASTVVGVVDTSGGPNALGLKRLIISTYISDIPAGDVITLTSPIQSVGGPMVGDYVEITGATNGKWRNNGFRWVIEEILSPTSLRLRPMSAKELQLVGTTTATTAEQPLLELSTGLESGESFGLATIYNGNFRRASDLSLLISPNIADASSSLDVYVSVPASTRDRAPNQFIDSLNSLYKRLGADTGTNTVTVGTKGRFQNLPDAMAWVAAQHNVPTSPSDRWEILLLESQMVSAKIPVTGSTALQIPIYITIRGITSNTFLYCTPGSPSFTYFGLNRAHLTFSNLAIVIPSRSGYRIATADGGTVDATVELLNVRFKNTYDTPINNAEATLMIFEFQNLVADLTYAVAREYVGGVASVSTWYGNVAKQPSVLSGSFWKKTTTAAQDLFMTGSGSASFELPTAAGSPEAALRLTDVRYIGQDAVINRSQIRSLVGGSGSNADALHTHTGIGTPGEKGDKGDPGAPGTPGYTPQKGIDYFDGLPGTTPVKGVDYNDGAPGAPGGPGPQGPAGSIGTIYKAHIGANGENLSGDATSVGGGALGLVVYFPANISSAWVVPDTSTVFTAFDVLYGLACGVYQMGTNSVAVHNAAMAIPPNSQGPFGPYPIPVWVFAVKA